MNTSTFEMQDSNGSNEMGQIEKFLSIGAGGLMLLRSLIGKKSIFSAIPAGYLLYRGLTGKCPVSKFVSEQVKINDAGHNIEVRTSITVDRPRKQVYTFWRKLENLPLFMKHIESVEVIDKIKSHWKMQVFENFGSLEWDAEITADKKNELISWQSLPDSQINNFGQVEFSDGDNASTVLNVIIKYTAPAGAPGEGVARLLNPLLKGLVKQDLVNFKSHIESKS